MPWDSVFQKDLVVTQSNSTSPVVGIVMGSRSDWSTLERASLTLEQFEVPHECEIV